MWRSLRRRIQKHAGGRFRRKIEKALALHRRGEVRADGLELKSAYTRLDVTWRARDIHPWDREAPSEKKAARFIQQAMEDADAAIRRLFDLLPEVDMIDVKVLARESEKVTMAGTVNRSSIVRHGTSVKMRLMNCGIRFYFAGLPFEPVEEAASEDAEAAPATASRNSR